MSVYLLVTLMSAVLSMLSLKILNRTTAVTSSPVLADGTMHYDWLAGRKIDQCGLLHCRVSRFQVPVNKRG